MFKKVGKSEQIRVIIWVLLASGFVPAQLAALLAEAATNPETLANIATLGLMVANTIWWIVDRVADRLKGLRGD